MVMIVMIKYHLIYLIYINYIYIVMNRTIKTNIVKYKKIKHSKVTIGILEYLHAAEVQQAESSEGRRAPAGIRPRGG